MRKNPYLFLISLIIISLFAVTGCTADPGEKPAVRYERPAIGFTAEEENVTELDLQKQYIMNIEAQDGIIRITRWDKDYIQVKENRKLKGPASKGTLKTLLGKNNYKVETTNYEVKLTKEPDKELKSLFRRTDDIELMVPDTINTVSVNAGSGAIVISGFNEMSGVDLKLKKGIIKADNCDVNRIDAEITAGELEVKGINGSGSYKCGRGDITLKDIKGTAEIKSVSGNTTIENLSGRLNADISSGSITLKASQLKADSMIYASYGEVQADLEGLETEGKYSIRAANGTIRLIMPENTGWSLLARSTKGKIKSRLELSPDELKMAPSGELYGDVKGGGPSIDIYIDEGDIILN